MIGRYIMFSIGDCVEFCFEGRELLNSNKRVDVKGSITRVNELGCFVKILTIHPQTSLLIGGRTYQLGDELYLLNNMLQPCAQAEDNPQDINHESGGLAWGWLLLSIALMVLWLISRGALE